MNELSPYRLVEDSKVVLDRELIFSGLDAALDVGKWLTPCELAVDDESTTVEWVYEIPR